VARILIADDDPAMGDVMSRKLASAGHEVHIERDGTAALEWARNFTPEVVIVDWMMPGMSGVQICKVLRRSPGLTDTRVVVVSGLSQQDRRREAFEAGADDFMAKPFDVNDLVKRVGEL
jgi:DNA-binding response OmpR family regulator